MPAPRRTAIAPMEVKKVRENQPETPGALEVVGLGEEVHGARCGDRDRDRVDERQVIAGEDDGAGHRHVRAALDVRPVDHAGERADDAAADRVRGAHARLGRFDGRRIGFGRSRRKSSDEGTPDRMPAWAWGVHSRVLGKVREDGAFPFSLHRGFLCASDRLPPCPPSRSRPSCSRAAAGGGEPTPETPAPTDAAPTSAPRAAPSGDGVGSP